MKRIMIVDDTLYNRLILRDLLLSHGYSVVAEAADGLHAMEAFSKSKPDLVIVDAAMPDMDAPTLTRRLKTEYPDATVVVSASRGQRSVVVEALTAGAADFIVKPYAAKRVIHTLKKALGQERAPLG